MNVSIKKRIYWSFTLLVLLFVVNGIASFFTLNNNRKLSEHISTVTNPSLQGLEEFEHLLVASKMYTTNWVFLRSNQDDKNALKRLQNIEYPGLKVKLNLLSAKWDNKPMADSLNKIFTRFEQLLAIEKGIMSSLKKFEDYDDPAAKLESERLVEDELLPRTSSLINALSRITSYEVNIRNQKNEDLEKSFMQLRMLISVLAITIIFLGILLSIHMARVIINPINKIRNIVNDLGKGITNKVSYKITNDEIGEMVRSVNSLSKKLQATANFATEIGNRNFHSYFEPLSSEDTLGLSLIAMRDSIKISDEKLNDAQHIAHIGSWERNIKTDKITLSDEMFFIFDIDPLTFDFQFQSIMKFIHPEDIERAMDISRKNLYMAPVPYECRIVTAKGVIKNILVETKVVLGKYGEVEKTFGIVQDITVLKESEAILETKNKELEIKNRELEQFAYVASHDLQEPLRTTSSFVGLLQKQYYGRFDENADKYLSYILQASDRMKILIKDLLDYSRIGSKQELNMIECNSILQDVLSDLDAAINESQANITYGSLPVVNGYTTEIKQLFQNLIFNAIKFRKKDVSPQIKISAKKIHEHWEFSFEDNGIGIDEKFSDKIFVIFQRLHTRTEYQGSGIGLSHCKKIVELHNGKIWFKSTPGIGTTFYFTLYDNNNEEINKNNNTVINNIQPNLNNNNFLKV